MITVLSRRARPGPAYVCFGWLALGFVAASAADPPPIYRCATETGLVFSDRPCAADAVVHELDESRVTIYAAPPISGRAFEARPSTARPRQNAGDKATAAQAKQQAACAKLERSLRETRSKLRAGYGISEGERLKERQRQLAERRRAEKCG